MRQSEEEKWGRSNQAIQPSKGGWHITFVTLSVCESSTLKDWENCKYFSSDWKFAENTLSVGDFSHLNYYKLRPRDT